MSNELFPDSYLLTYLNDVKTLVETNPIFSKYKDKYKYTYGTPERDQSDTMENYFFNPLSYLITNLEAYSSKSKDENYYEKIVEFMNTFKSLPYVVIDCQLIMLYTNVYTVLYFYLYCSNEVYVIAKYEDTDLKRIDQYIDVIYELSKRDMYYKNIKTPGTTFCQSPTDLNQLLSCYECAAYDIHYNSDKKKIHQRKNS